MNLIDTCTTSFPLLKYKNYRASNQNFHVDIKGLFNGLYSKAFHYTLSSPILSNLVIPNFTLAKKKCTVNSPLTDTSIRRTPSPRPSFSHFTVNILSTRRTTDTSEQSRDDWEVKTTSNSKLPNV